MKGRSLITQVVLTLFLANSTRLSVDAQSPVPSFLLGGPKDLSTAVAIRTDFNRITLERRLRVSYSFLIKSFFKRMDSLMFLPASQLQELFLGYFSVLQDQGIINERVYDNLNHLLIGFMNSNPDLYFYGLLPKFLVRLRMQRLMRSSTIKHIYGDDGSYIQLENRRDLRRWLKTSIPELDDLIKTHTSKFMDRNLELFAMILSGLSSYVQRQRQSRNVTGQFLLNEYLDRLEFVKIANKRFSPKFRDFISQHINDLDSPGLAQELTRLSSSLLEDHSVQNWANLQQQFENKYWTISKANRESLLSYIDYALLNNPSIVNPQFRSYYILKFKDLINQLDEERQRKFFNDPENTLNLLKRDFFPQFNKVESFLSAFKLFIDFMGLSPIKTLEKSFDAFSYELKNIHLVDEETERKLNSQVKSVVQSRVLKVKSEESESLLDRILNKNCDNVSFRQILTMIGVSHFASNQIRFHSRLFWKRYYEFYNIRKPTVIPFNLKALLRIIKNYSKTRGVYTLRSIVSHYADNLETIALLKSTEKEYFIRIILGILFRGYIRAGKLNFRMAFKKYKDHIVKFLHQPPNNIVSRTKTFGGSHQSFELGLSLRERLKTQLSFIEKIRDYERKATFKEFKVWARNYLHQNYKYGSHLGRKFTSIFEKIRDNVIPNLPQELGTIKSPLKLKLLLSQLSIGHQVKTPITPIFERVKDNVHKPQGHEFGLALIECFRHNFSGVQFSSWLALQAAFRQYLDNLEGVELSQGQISIIEQLLDYLRPFYSDGSLNYAKFLASFPDDIEIVDEQGNPRKNVFQLLKDYKAHSAVDLVKFWTRIAEMAASFYDEKKYKAINDLVVSHLLNDKNTQALTVSDKTKNPDWSQVFTEIEKKLQNDLSDNTSIEPDNKKVFVHFFLNIPFESFVKAKSILAAARRFFAHKPCGLYSEILLPNHRVFTTVLGYETFSKVKLMLEKYNANADICGRLNIYRPSHHKSIKELLGSSPVTDSDVQIFFNFFLKFSKTLFVMSPLTSARIRARSNANLQFCSRSRQKLNMLYERVKVNEKLNVKKAELKYIKQLNYKAFKFAKKSQQAFNLFKVLYFTKRHTSIHQQIEWIKFLNAAVASLENSSSISVLRKRLFKFLDSSNPMKIIVDVKTLNSIFQSSNFSESQDDPHGFSRESITSVRKRIYKFFEQGTKFALYSKHYMPTYFEQNLNNDKSQEIPAGTRKRYFKTLVSDMLKKLVAARGSNLMQALTDEQNNDYPDGNGQTIRVIRKKVLKFLSSNTMQVSSFIKYAAATNALTDKQTNMNLRKHLFKYLDLLNNLSTNFVKSPRIGQHSQQFPKTDQQISAVRKIIIKSLASLNKAQLSMMAAGKVQHSASSTNGHPDNGKDDHDNKDAILRIRKQLFKYLPVGIKQVTAFIHHALANHNSSLQNTDNTALESGIRKRFFKYINDLQKLNTKYMHIFLGGSHSETYDTGISPPGKDKSPESARISAVRKKILKSLSDLNNTYISVLRQNNLGFSHASTNDDYPKDGKTDGISGGVVLSSRKRLFKYLPVGIREVTSFVKSAMAANHWVDSVFNMTLRKHFIKDLEIINEMQLDYVKYFEGGQHTDTTDDAKIGAIRKILLKNISNLNSVKLKALKQIRAQLSHGSTNTDDGETGQGKNRDSAVVTTIKKKLYKFFTTLKNIKLSASHLLTASISEQSNNRPNEERKQNHPSSRSFIGIVRKRLVKYFDSLPKMNLTVVKYFDPRLSVIDNSVFRDVEKDKDSDRGIAVHGVAKRLFKFLLINKSPQMDYFVKKRATEYLKGLQKMMASGMAAKMLHYIPADQHKVFMDYIQHIKLLAARLSNEKDHEHLNYKASMLKYVPTQQLNELTMRKKLEALTRNIKPTADQRPKGFKANMLKYVPKEHLMDMTMQKTLNALMRRIKPVADKRPNGFKAKLYHFISKLSHQVMMKSSLFSGKMNKSNLINSFKGFKAQLLKHIAVETAMSMNKSTAHNAFQSKGLVNSAGPLNNFHSALLKRKSMLTEVMLSFLKKKLNSSTLEKIRNDAVLRAITFKSIMQIVSQRLKFIKFARNYIIRNSIIKPKIESLSTRVILKRLESAQVEKNFLKYLRQNQNPRLVDKLLKLSRVPDGRIKLNKIVKLFGDMTLLSRKKVLSPLEKIRQIYHSFNKQSTETLAGSNQLKEGDQNANYITFVDKIIEYLQNSNEFGRVRLPVSKAAITSEETIVCCTCCCQDNDNGVEGGEHKDCDCSKKQEQANKDPTFIKRASQMVNVDPVVNIRVRVQNEYGQVVKQETFVLNQGQEKGRRLQQEADQFIEASSARLI
jgi:hypothetical protein